MPEVPSYISGVAIFRGRPIGVVDLRKRFSAEALQRGRLIVLKPEEDSPSLLVDDVLGIREVAQERLSLPRKVYRGLKARFIEAMYEASGGMVIVLKVQELLSSRERIVLKKALQRATMGSEDGLQGQIT